MSRGREVVNKTGRGGFYRCRSAHRARGASHEEMHHRFWRARAGAYACAFSSLMAMQCIWHRALIASARRATMAISSYQVGGDVATCAHGDHSLQHLSSSRSADNEIVRQRKPSWRREGMATCLYVCNNILSARILFTQPAGRGAARKRCRMSSCEE